jgi:hypothetical protein
MTAQAAVHLHPPVDPLLRRYVDGQATDATGTIRLADEVWPAAAYEIGPRTRSVRSISFIAFESFLRPYAKWYVYEHVLMAGRPTSSVTAVLAALRALDRALASCGVSAIEGLASPDTVREVWRQLARPEVRGDSHRQVMCRRFLRVLRANFGLPAIVPRPVQGRRRPLSEIAADDSRVIPEAVVRQIVERLAQHRDGVAPLEPRDALFLAMLVLHIALGRRVSELLLAPRGSGDDGPLVSFVAADGTTALGFRFVPSKDGGPNDVVYVSPAWEDVVRYCVASVLATSDVARPYADDASRGLFALAWSGNGTRFKPRGGPSSRTAAQRRPAAAITYMAFYHWLRGRPGEPGAMERWGITESGEPGDPIYVFRSHSARHTRQSALSRDPNVSRLAAQRDLNTRSRDVQGIYQHGLADQNERLLAKLDAGALLGSGAAWLNDVRLGHEPGRPRSTGMDPRIRDLIAASPAFLEFNRVPAGYCVRPQGPAACPEFLACLEATDDGCAWFATDPDDEAIVEEIRERATERRAGADRAAAAGNVVLSGKLAVLAGRAESFVDQTAAARESLARLRARVAVEESA